MNNFSSHCMHKVSFILLCRCYTTCRLYDSLFSIRYA